jgi:hypothetical protein
MVWIKNHIIWRFAIGRLKKQTLSLQHNTKGNNEITLRRLKFKKA